MRTRVSSEWEAAIWLSWKIIASGGYLPSLSLIIGRSDCMRAIATELLKDDRGSLKFLLNDSAIAFFPATIQHRDSKFDGLSYEDDYRGNALAGLITEERVEIRFHSAFSDERVKSIWSRVMAVPEISAARLGRPYYQGRELV